MDIGQLNQIFSMLRENEEILFETKNKPLGCGGSGVVYPIIYSNKEIKNEEQALKVIDIMQLSKTNTGKDNDWKDIKDEKLTLYKKELEVNKNITACRCEHLIRIYDTYVIDRPSQDICLCAIRMPYYETLEWLLDKESLDEKNLIRLGTHICEALSVLHHDAKNEYYRASQYRIGIMLHMDIKPSNIFYRWEGTDLIFMLGDFGTLIDKSAGEVIGGTRGFLAPELKYLLESQNDSEISENETPAESADIFSLGITLFYCLAENDKEIRTTEYWEARCNGYEVEKPCGCSKELWEVIEKATSKDPKNRYQTAKEMQTALQNVDNKKAEVAVRENDVLKLEKAIMGATIAIGIADRTWKWMKGKFGKKDRICIEGDNIVYEGEVKNGYPHGQGTYIYRYGKELRSFNGKWKWTEEKPKFLGTKVIYTGMVCNGRYKGFAKIVIPELGTYIGTVKDLDFEVGDFRWEDGSLYSGTWKKKSNGGYCQHGFGKYVDAQGKEIIGEWNEGNLIED